MELASQLFVCSSPSLLPATPMLASLSPLQNQRTIKVNTVHGLRLTPAISWRSGYSDRSKRRPIRCFSLSALTPELKNTLDKVVTAHKVVVFMKGTKEFPQCGFSNTVVQVLKSLNVPFETINILENEALRLGLKEYSAWPTFPQLYIDGEFFGGCDITVEAYKNGELQEVLERANCS